jgi:oligopeptide transport system substrate-binding protein
MSEEQPPAESDAVSGAAPQEEPPGSPPIHTFLIADIRSSTTYTVTHGDEAWAQLAMRFAQIARAGVEAHGGRVIELRGDEVLADFSSVRSALHAAVDLQARLAADAQSDPEHAIRCGVGVDAGEAVAVDGGYRSLALNLAARLCSIAGPGEVLSSETVISLAHTVPGLTYVERSPATLKGFPTPVRVIEILPSASASAVALRRRGRASRLGYRRARLLFVAGGLGAAAVVAGLLTLLNVHGYRDDVSSAAAYLDTEVWKALAALAVAALVSLGLAWWAGRAHPVVGGALSAGLLLALVLLLFAAPQLPPTDCGTLVCPPRAPADQQVLHLENFTASPDIQLDPAQMSFTGEIAVGQLLFPALVRLDAHLQVIPWAAARYRISPDGMTYTFTLRPGVQWSDKTPIHADDFAYALNRALDPCAASPAAYLLFPIQHAQRFNEQPCDHGQPTGAIQTLIGDSLLVSDPQTLALKLEQPAAYMLQALTTWEAFAVPRSLVQTYGATWTDHLVDGGGWGGDLFVLSAVERQVNTQTQGNTQTHLVLTRNERFWGTKPKLRAMEFTFSNGDDTVAYKDYVAGTGDVSGISSTDLASARLRGKELRSSGQLGTFSYGVSWTIPPFDDVRMRQAFALALDRGKLVSDAFGDRFIPSSHLVPEGMPGYNPNLTGPNNSGLRGNVQRAQALAQAYANEKCGGSLSACPPVTLAVADIFLGASDMATETQQMWQQALPRYPISVQKVKQLGAEFELVRAKQAQLWVFPWGADYPDPRDFLSVLFLPGAEVNLGQVALPAATTLMQKADAETDQAARLSEYQQAEQDLVNSVAMIPLLQFKTFYLVRPFVIGYSTTAAGVTTSDTWQRVYIAQH